MRAIHVVRCSLLAGLIGCAGGTDGTIVSEITGGPDLVETSISNPPASASVGSTFSVTDTVQNSGASDAVASQTRYYLSADTVRGGGDTVMTPTRAVGALAAGASDSGSVTVTVPPTPSGTYYVLACADGTNTNTENSEGNNCIASATTVNLDGPDLVVATLTDPPASALDGATFSATDTTTNNGSSDAVASTTRYFLSLDGVNVAPGTKQLANRAIGALASGASDNGSVSITIPAGTPQGTYYLFACADKTAAVAETSESNNCRASASTMVLTAPDLTDGDVSATPATLDVTQQLSITDTVTNNSMTAAGASETRFILSVDNVRSSDDGFIRSCLSGGNTPARQLAPLNGGDSSTGTTPVALCVRDQSGLHQVAAGTYYVLACADDTGLVAESDETNNCAVSTATIQITVCGNGTVEAGEACDDGNTIAGDGCSPTCTNEPPPDLVVSAVTEPPPGTATGATFDITDTTTNQPGFGPAGPSTTAYYLSVDRIKSGGDVTLTGTRSVGALNGGVSSPGTVTVTVPTIPTGSYFLIACADANGMVGETDETNNCLASTGTVSIGGADLVVTAVSNPPATATNGQSFSVSDTTQDSGSAGTPATVTRYFVSADGVHPLPGSNFIGARSVGSLAANGTSSGSATATIPAGIPAGSYFILGCADKTNVVSETQENNNCFASASTVAVTGPDLTETTVAQTPASVTIGTSVSVTDTVTNSTMVAAGSSATRFYASSDAAKSNDDLLLRVCSNATVVQRNVPALASGASSMGTTNVALCYRDGAVTRQVPAGTWFVIACADDNHTVSETSETNNCTASATSFSITP